MKKRMTMEDYNRLIEAEIDRRDSAEKGREARAKGLAGNEPEEIETTADVLASMLQENTGRHFLDSGGAYGRHWERNQGRDFAAEQETAVRFSVYRYQGEERLEIELTHNVYHWLLARLDFNAELDAEWQAYCEEQEEYGQLDAMTGFLQDRRPDAGGIYGDGEPMTINTYNGEDLLSQTLQYVYWCDDDGEHVLLQIHGGCDVRGGYTDARAFDVDGECAMFDNARAVLYVDRDTVPESNPHPLLPGMPDPEPNWFALADAVGWHTDDGCHFYAEQREQIDGEWRVLDDLGDYPVCEFEEQEDGVYRNEDGRELDAVRGRGVVCVTDDGDAYCPLSGGRILGSAW